MHACLKLWSKHGGQIHLLHLLFAVLHFLRYHEMKKINDKVKVCFITAYEVFYEQLKEEFPSLDIGCFIKKPVEISELVRRVKAELGLM